MGDSTRHSKDILHSSSLSSHYSHYSRFSSLNLFIYLFKFPFAVILIWFCCFLSPCVQRLAVYLRPMIYLSIRLSFYLSFSPSIYLPACLCLIASSPFSSHIIFLAVIINDLPAVRIAHHTHLGRQEI